MAAKISMFIKRNKLFFIALAIAIGTALTYAVVNAVLAHFDLQLTRYVLYTTYSICFLCVIFMFLHCIVACIKKVRKNEWYRLAVFAELCLLGAFLFLQLLIVAFGYYPIHIVERNGKTFIAYSKSVILDTWVDYYDYHGWIVCGKQVQISDYYDGCFDPLSEKYQ